MLFHKGYSNNNKGWLERLKVPKQVSHVYDNTTDSP